MISLLYVAGKPIRKSFRAWRKALGDKIKEVVIMDQGGTNRGFHADGVKVVYVEKRKKGLADIDRQEGAILCTQPWTMMVDTDEFPGPAAGRILDAIKDDLADVIIMEFKNTVNGVDIKSILGPDPHPRLWRTKMPPVIEWPTIAHTYPRLNTSRIAYIDAPVIHHRRTLREIIETHNLRRRVIHPQAIAQEERFIQAVQNLLGGQKA